MVTIGGRYLKQRLQIYGSKLQHVSLPQTFKFPLVMQKLQHHHNQFHLYFYLLILSFLQKSENKQNFSIPISYNERLFLGYWLISCCVLKDNVPEKMVGHLYMGRSESDE